MKGSPPSPVTTTQLTPEELEEIRRKYPATKRDKAFKKPVEIKTKPKGDNDMAKAKFNLTEEQFNTERSSGKTIGRIAEEQGVSEATIYNHISKWAEARKPAQQKLLREKDVSPAADPKAELLDKAEKEIERLTTENQRLDQRMVSAQNEATKAWAEVERLRDKQDESDQQWTKQVSSLIGEKEEWLADNLRLEEKVLELQLQISQQNTVPDSEVQRLDTAIQDLTRARWILGRLSAAGE